jgi:integrase
MTLRRCDKHLPLSTVALHATPVRFGCAPRLPRPLNGTRTARRAQHLVVRAPLRVGVEVADAAAMTYIVQRQDRFYVVAYDGLDPLTGKERRRWHPAGRKREDAAALAAHLDNEATRAAPTAGGSITLGTFLRNTWLPQKRRQVRATTAYRYAWFVDRYIDPAIGTVPLRRLQADHLDALYTALATTGGRHGTGLAPKTVLEVHMIVRDVAVEEVASELATFLDHARNHRLYPALHLAAHTGMRRGEVVGLKWSDLDLAGKRLSIVRTMQCVGGRPVEFGVKTRTSRRCIDLDDTTIAHLVAWQQRLRDDGIEAERDDWMFCNTTSRFLNPQSLSQLFHRITTSAQLPRIRFHDLRHTHASLLVAAGVPIKVVTERLGHAHPGFTMKTYQHVMPGMSAAAADQFAALVADSTR